MRVGLLRHLRGQRDRRVPMLRRRVLGHGPRRHRRVVAAVGWAGARAAAARLLEPLGRTDGVAISFAAFPNSAEAVWVVWIALLRRLVVSPEISSTCRVGAVGGPPRSTFGASDRVSREASAGSTRAPLASAWRGGCCRHSRLEHEMPRRVRMRGCYRGSGATTSHRGSWQGAWCCRASSLPLH
jgi:hypothetical protein